MSQPPGSGLHQPAPRSDLFAIAALTFAVVSAAFSVAAFVLASEASNDAQSAKDIAHRAARAPNTPVAPTTQAPATGGPATVRVTEQEFTITPGVSSVAGGKVTFEITNAGKTSHEFVVIRTEHDAKALPVDQQTGKVIENRAGDKTVGKINQIKPGATKSTTFTLSAGRYALICNIPGHYQAGMSTAFTAT